MTTATPEAPKQDLVDPNQQRKMNNARDLRRDVILAAMQYCHDRAHTKLSHPGLKAMFTTEDVMALVPDVDKIGVLDQIGQCVNSQFIAFGYDPISKQDLTDRFCVTDLGAGAFTAAYAKAKDRLVLPDAKSRKPASTASSAAGA